MRTSTPRIEAHYQFYHTAVELALKNEQESQCPIWIHFDGKQYCSATLDQPHALINEASLPRELQFDRVLGDHDAPASILYTDITSELFGHFHKILADTARRGKSSYRIRYRRSSQVAAKPLIIPGYGVELQLKRTDYIVIDDRNEAAGGKDNTIDPDIDDVSDLKPLSSSELGSLGMKASSYIMHAKNPLDTLVKISQDFPKYSSLIKSQDISEAFVAEHKHNRAQMVPEGYNVWWLNGLQLSERNIQPLALLETIRKERKLVRSLTHLGLSPQQAIQLLSHEAMSESNTENEPQRYDWRDDVEDGKAIIWLNNLEKDKRYAGMPTSVKAVCGYERSKAPPANHK